MRFKNNTATHHQTSYKTKLVIAFTLAEVLITLAIIGIVAMMTIPTLIQNTQHQEWVSGVTKFYSIMNQAVLSWKADIGCGDNAYTCLLSQGLSDNACSNFDQIGKFLNIVDSYEPPSAFVTSSLMWLPNTSYDYNGNQLSNSMYGLSNNSYGCKFLLKDGSTMNIDSDPSGFGVHFDVNGKKGPNRIGKDIYLLFIGERAKNDIHPDSYNAPAGGGLCWWSGGIAHCTPGTIDPSQNNGATPTSYVLLNKQIPNYYP